jgi:hypothetical protein
VTQAAFRFGAPLSPRSQRARAASVLRMAAIAFTFSAFAPVSVTAQAEGPVSVWHRSADGCPGAQAFLDELRARNVHARLAQVGDTIDFVVTLGAGPRGRSRGVLERQTQTGTVAIRSVDDASCVQVSQALALTLALSIAPSARSPAQDDAEVDAAAPDALVRGTAAPASPAALAQPSAANTGAPAAMSAPPAAAREPQRTPEEPAAHRAHAGAGSARSVQAALWSVGVRGAAAIGIAPDLLASGAAFAGFEPVGAGLFAPALRLSALFAYASSTASGRAFRLRIVGARLDGCPLAVSAGPLAARPCLGAELGSIASDGQGTGGRSDSGLWAALAGEARLTWRVSGPWGLEAHAGLALPLTRYELVADDGAAVLHRTSDLAFSAGLGALVQIP